VTVFGWRDLVSIPPATAGGMGRTDHVDMNGVRYPESVRSYFSGSNGSTVEYNLYRACKAFHGTAGLDDTSASAGTAVVQLYTDGTQAFRLTVTAAIGGGRIAAVGTPQVLCGF
jgi:NPCBM/NEW2 domain